MPRTHPPTEFEVLGFRRRGFSATGTPSTANVSFGGLAAVISGDSPVQGQIYAGFTPTIYAAPASVGTGDGSSEGNARSLALVLTEVSQGAIVGCIPGVYTGSFTGERYIACFCPTSSGTSLSPIRIVAKYQATSLSNVGSNADRCELRSGGTTYTNGSPVFGGSDGINHTHWYGFYVNEANSSALCQDTGLFIAFRNTGTRAYNCVLVGGSISWTNNHAGVYWDAATSPVLSNCRVHNFTNTSPGSNETLVMMYSALNYTIEYCDLYDTTSLLYIKGNTGTGNNYGSMHHCYAHDFGNLRYQEVDAVNGNRFHHNVFRNFSGSAGFRTSFGTDGHNVHHYNNTYIVNEPCDGAIHILQAAPNDLQIYDNLFVGTFANAQIINAYSMTGAFGNLSGNHYYNTTGTGRFFKSGTQYDGSSNWIAAMSEADTVQTNPLLADINGTDVTDFVPAIPNGCGAYAVGNESIGVSA